MTRQYWATLNLSQKKELAKRVGTSHEYLRHIFMHGKTSGPHMALLIEKATAGKITAALLRPDLFGERVVDTAQSA